MKATPAKGVPVPGGDRLLQRIFTRLGCQGRPPHFVVEFYPYANLTHTVRFTRDTARVRLSDLLRNAPIEIVDAAAATSPGCTTTWPAFRCRASSMRC